MRFAFVNGVTVVHKGSAMKTTHQRTGNLKVAAMLAILLVALDIRGLAQNSIERTQRLVLVSIPDRKLAVLENGELIARFSVSVGAEVTESTRRIRNRQPRAQSNLLPRRRRDSAGQRQSGRHSLAWLEHEGLRDSRNERAVVDWTRRFARMHPPA
jgi:hypothetical protein